MKQWLTLTACLFLCWTNIPAQNLKFGKPTDEELNMAVYEQDQDAAAVVLCQLTNVDYTVSGSDYLVDYKVKTRIKILKDEGKESANLTIHYIDNPDEQYTQESIEEFKATAYNMEDGKVRKTHVGREKIFSERIDEDWMLAKVAIPQVKAGTVIEYEYTLHSNVFYHIHDWYAQTDIPVAYANYRLEIPVFFIFNVEKTGLQPLESSVTTGSINYKMSSNDMENLRKCNTNIYTCTGRNLKALKKDEFVWNLRDYSTKVTAELQRVNLRGGQDVRKKWEQVDNTLFNHPEFGSHLYKHGKYQEELDASGISDIGDIKEKVAATYKFLRQRLAWNGEYELLVKSASDVMKRGGGSNADLNMMLINMLYDVGVEAYPVVMSTRLHGHLPQTYPSLNKLNTFIVGVPDGASWLFLDASSSDGYLNVLPANLYTDRARIIQKGKEGKWVDLQEIGESRTQVIVNASLQPDGKMTGELAVTFYSNAAAYERQVFRVADDSMAFILNKALKNDITIMDCKMEGHRDFAPTMKEVIQFIKQGEATGDYIYLNPFIGIPVTSNPFLAPERILPVEFPYKQVFSMNVKIKLPDGWKLEEMPKGIKVSTDDKSIAGHLLYESSDAGVVSINYLFRLNQITYFKDQYDTLRQLFDLLSNRSKDMLIFKKE